MDNDAELLVQMRKNQADMRKLEKTFFISGCLSVVANLYYTYFAICLVPGMLWWDEKFFLIDTAAAIISVVCSIMSSCKHKNWTVWALTIFLIRVIEAVATYGLMHGIPMMLLGALPQYICLREYQKLDFLKTQFGYPGFNVDIYLHRAKRNMSDEEVRARMKMQKAVERNDMPGLESPDTGRIYEEPRPRLERPKNLDDL